MAVVVAEGTLHEHILDVTYPTWGEGLSRTAYGNWNRGQLQTDWGRVRLQRMALVDGPTLLSSAKRYDLEASAAGRPVRVLGIGAVFTPPELRGHGYARQLVEELAAAAARDGCEFALLFSEIGPDYYASLGFHVARRSIVTIDVTRKAGAPATFIRAGGAADLPALAEISSGYARGAGFSLFRSPEFIGFGIARKRLLAGLGPPGLREVDFFIAEEGHRPAAYVVITRGPNGPVLQECGDRDPSGARIGAILQVLEARAPAEPVRPLRAWLPAGLCPPQIEVRDEAPAADVMMIRPLGTGPAAVEDLHPVVYWQADVF